MQSKFYTYGALFFSVAYLLFGAAAAWHDHSWLVVMDKILPIVTLWTQAPHNPFAKPGE
jgi:hypothetical protein